MTTVHSETDNVPGVVPRVGCHIAPSRVIWLSIVSFGLYWFYWMYRTWKQYRDHTGKFAHPVALSGREGTTVMWWYHPRFGSVCYPFWHGMTQIVPVYQFFRFHAHVRSYKELMRERGVPDTLNVGLLTTIVVITGTVEWVTGALSGSEQFQYSPAIELLFHLIRVATLAVVIGVIVRIQNNLNRYWADVDDRFTANARFGKGEILVIVLGILLWIGVAADIIWS